MPTGIPELTYFRGRVALAAALKGLGIGRGDAVAIQAFTCIAVPEAVLGVGATPVYIDVEPSGFNMDPGDLARKLTPQVRAVVAQHTFGIPADLRALLAIADTHRIPLLEDCAHTVASRYGGREVGSFGMAAFYSYEASKPIFVGIGGSLRVNDSAMHERIRAQYASYTPPSAFIQGQLLAMFLAHGLLYRPSTYWTIRAIFRRLVALGLIKGNYNAVPTEETPPAEDFSRAMGGIQRRLLDQALRRLAAQTAHRRTVAAAYRTGIDAANVQHPQLHPDADPVYGRYPMLVDRKSDVVAKARTAQVELADFYATPVHPLSGAQLAAVRYEPGSCPRAEQCSTRVVSLPTGPGVDERQTERAVRFFRSLN